MLSKGFFVNKAAPKSQTAFRWNCSITATHARFVIKEKIRGVENEGRIAKKMSDFRDEIDVFDSVFDVSKAWFLLSEVLLEALEIHLW